MLAASPSGRNWPVLPRVPAPLRTFATFAVKSSWLQTAAIKPHITKVYAQTFFVEPRHRHCLQLK